MCPACKLASGGLGRPSLPDWQTSRTSSHELEMPRTKPRFEERLVELNPWRSATRWVCRSLRSEAAMFSHWTGPTPTALRPKRRRHALRRLWPGGARLRPQSDVEIGATSRSNRRSIERLNRSSIKRQSIDRPSFDSAWYMPTTWSSRALKRSFCLLSRRSLSRSNRPPSSRRRRAGIRTKRSD
jgi:hypothetical protein